MHSGINPEKAAEEMKPTIIIDDPAQYEGEVERGMMYLLTAPLFSNYNGDVGKEEAIAALKQGDQSMWNYAYEHSLIKAENHGAFTALLRQHAKDAYSLAEGLQVLHESGRYTDGRRDVLAEHPQHALQLAHMYRYCPEELLEKNFADLLKEPQHAGNAASMINDLNNAGIYQEYRDYLMRHRQHTQLASTMVSFNNAGILRESLDFLEAHLHYLDRLSGPLLWLTGNLVTQLNFSRLVYLIDVVPESEFADPSRVINI